MAAVFTPDPRPFIDGARRASNAREKIADLAPATGALLCELPAGDATDVDQAVVAARRAFEDGRWRLRSLADRRAMLLRLADLIEAHGDELALIEALEVGKAVANARDEVAMSTGWLRFYAEAIDKLYGAVAPADGDLLAFNIFVPRGVVGAIVPWNFPLANAVMKAAPALAAGNSVVLKPSEIASLSALRFADLAMEAGLPPGVLNVLPGLGATVGAAIARHDDIDFLSFTGSTQTGRLLMRHAGETNGKPLMLECGGKSPQVVCADVADDLEALAARIVQDAFWNQGQWCSARTRLIVEDALYDPLLEAVVAAAQKLIPGEPLDPTTRYGTQASAQQYDRVCGYVALGLTEGAKPLLMGAQGAPTRASIAPTIFGEVTAEMRIGREEIFGPVLCAMRALDFADAVVKANDTTYGLSATVWTRDARKIKRAVQQIRAGRVVVRSDPHAVGSAGLACGGEPCGASGFGVEKGVDGLKSYCRVQAVEVL